MGTTVKNGDYAFMLHIIGSLKSTGKGAVILPHGVFRGNVEGHIRKNVIKKVISNISARQPFMERVFLPALL